MVNLDESVTNKVLKRNASLLNLPDHVYQDKILF